MALRKQTKHISSDSQQMDENTQDDDSATDRDTGDEFSSLLLSAPSTREKRRRKRENKVKHKAVNSEMTEEEMMDLALRLSEREASVSALQQQQEEEAVMKAIQESMVSQTQPCLSSASKTLLANASLRLGSRRKLLYSNGVSSVFAADQGRLEDCSATEFDLKSKANGAADKKTPCSRKRKRKAGSPLLEMPDSSQSSPCSFEPFSAPLDSPQSSDSTQIEDSQLQKSPVFPLTGCRAAVHVDRLSQDLVETCRSSGFVLCSQDSWTLTEPRSPTFPQSNPVSCPKIPVFSGTEQVDNGQVEHETSPTACKRHRSENTEFMFSSQESLSPSARSCGSKSPVFPKSPQKPKILPPSDELSFHKNLDPGRAEENHKPSTSPVFGKTEPQLKKSAGPSASERRSSECEEKLDRREKTKSDGSQVDEFTIRPPKAEKLDQKSKDSAETELTSDMTLIWTDEDEDDNTLDGSPSPVFPEERSLHQAEDQAASLTHQDQTGSDHRKQLSTTEEETRPVSRQEEDCRATPPPGESSGGTTVHYYWGVPFCPRGLNPDTYTQVILAQMQVYQTSLKQAQRGLLRKAEWGEAIQPQPEKSPSPEASAKSPQLQAPRRKGLRLRGRKITEPAESPPAEEEERKEEEDEEQEKEEEEIKKDDEEQIDTDDCDVCPETQLSNDDTQDLTEAEAEPPAEHPEPPEVEMILQLDSPVRVEPQEEEAADTHTEAKGNVSSCGGDAGSRAAEEETEAMEDSRDPDTEKKRSRGLQRSPSPELEPAVVPRSPDTSVDCPICQASFPVSEIELHAAYCDGEVAVVGERRHDGDRFQGSVKLPRKRTRRAERTAVGRNDSSEVCSNQEKCYICQKAVPLREYTRHTESCIESQRRPKANLLSALERTESRDSDAGPSGSKVQPDAVIDLRDDDDDDEAASAFRISDSPIRSFTSISEATGCLIDFKKQHRAKKPSQRRR